MPLLKTVLKAAVVTLVLFGFLYGSFKLWVNGIVTLYDSAGDVVSASVDYYDDGEDIELTEIGFGWWVRFGIPYEASLAVYCKNGTSANLLYLSHAGHYHYTVTNDCRQHRVV